ncbi:bifunctional histidinol-phosphatase/imidazoleglycerol-phosphate dehydratase HisB [Chitinophaga cymbidii]|uniref:Histidine biosynthesis bifunctional protein HisB n=1 Tax=Chitinophaga cymbidii TaxID=1096750 RepID=A0A512RL08_9BACT|nr:bifunctional histidinol-phosphatase/imidazoleglycerol-phosphate dehydratase HisB [Chitinophaga cymbidii]GEP96388.1 histidine biosynthesis bifunctional protein HisB [Chitinophaga cymbidii]
MKRVLFIDRDGTMIKEVPPTYQIDSLEKVEFYPKVFTYLGKIAAELDYELVMVTNQDGLGTPSFPEDTFTAPHRHIMQSFENEGIKFAAVHIDKSFPEDNLPTRKPGIGMLKQYFSPDYDLANSYVIGDRITDVKLAQNLGAKAIWLNAGTSLGAGEVTDAGGLQDVIALESTDWAKIYEFLKIGLRKVEHIRTTKETDIRINLNLDGKGQASIHTGLAFFDHMLDQIARHGSIDLDIQAKGDLHIDEHHTIEDTGIALGEAFAMALADKKGTERYGFCLPMDDCLAQVAIDFGGRNWIVWDAEFKREKIGEMPTEMFFHFFKSFSDAAKCNLNIKAEGENEHHKIEAIFKAFAKAIKMAVKRNPDNMQLPSTKGVL